MSAALVVIVFSIGLTFAMELTWPVKKENVNDF